VLPEVPSRPRAGGRRRHGDREVPTATVFVVMSGCTWQQLPAASVRVVRRDGPPPVHRVDEGSGVGRVAPPGPRRTRLPVRSRRGSRRRRTGKPTPTATCSNGSTVEVSGTASHAKASRPPGDSAGTGGPSNAPWSGSPGVGVSTTATNAGPSTFSPSPTSSTASSATAGSPGETDSQPVPKRAMSVVRHDEPVQVTWIRRDLHGRCLAHPHNGTPRPAPGGMLGS
jgi:hypothetical protein